MSDTPTPSTPPADDHDNEEFGGMGAMGQSGYPEESPEEVQADGEPKRNRPEQPQRDEG